MVDEDTLSTMSNEELFRNRHVSWRVISIFNRFDYFLSLSRYIDEKTFEIMSWDIGCPDKKHQVVNIWMPTLSKEFINEVIVPYITQWNQTYRCFGGRARSFDLVRNSNAGAYGISIPLHKKEIAYLKRVGEYGW